MVASETLPGGPGFIEEGVHSASGLRCHVQTGTFKNSEACVASANIANASSWTVLPVVSTASAGFAVPQGTSTIATGAQSLFRSRLPFPCTPCITYRQTNAAPSETQTFSIRVTGYDQFGTYVQETVENQTVTPSIALGVPTESYVRRTRLWLSKVFHAITRIEYKAANVQGVSDYIDVGVAWNFDFSSYIYEPYTNYIAKENQGVGTMLRMSPYGPNQPTIAPEILGVELTNLTPQVWPITQIPISNPTTLNLGTGTAGLANIPLATPATPLVSYTVANPTVLTVNAAITSIGMTAGQRFKVRIAGDQGTPGINGDYIATAISATTFSIPVNVTVAGSTASIWVMPPPLPGAAFSAATTTNQYEPVEVLVNGNTPTLINGFHHARITSNWSVTVPINTTAAGTSGMVKLLNPVSSVVHPYNSALSGSSLTGGYRLGTNASNFRGTENKWALVRSTGNASQPNGTPLLPTDTPIIDAALIYPQFPWFHTDVVQFRVYYRSGRGTYRGTNGRSTYAT